MRYVSRWFVVALLVGLCMPVAAAQDPVTGELSKLAGGLVTGGRTFFLRTAGGKEFKGEIRFDPSRSPKQLDFIHADHDVVWQAIYTVDEETFRLNYVDGGGGDPRRRCSPRPPIQPEP